MPRRLSRRLAGYIAIEFLLGATLWAPVADYQAGFAATESAQALALEDRHGARAVIATVGFALPLSTADLIAAQAIKQYGLERANIVLHSVGDGKGDPPQAVQVIGAALGDLRAASVSYGNVSLRIADASGVCRAVLSPAAVFQNCEPAGGRPVRGPIRSAFRIVDLAHGLARRNDPLLTSAVQALALGDAVVIVSSPEGSVQAGPGMIVAASAALESDPRIDSAIAEVLSRVQWKSRAK